MFQGRRIYGQMPYSGIRQSLEWSLHSSVFQFLIRQMGLAWGPLAGFAKQLSSPNSCAGGPDTLHTELKQTVSHLLVSNTNYDKNIMNDSSPSFVLHIAPFGRCRHNATCASVSLHQFPLSEDGILNTGVPGIHHGFTTTSRVEFLRSS